MDQLLGDPAEVPLSRSARLRAAGEPEPPADAAVSFLYDADPTSSESNTRSIAAAGDVEDQVDGVPLADAPLQLTLSRRAVGTALQLLAVAGLTVCAYAAGDWPAALAVVCVALLVAGVLVENGGR